MSDALHRFPAASSWETWRWRLAVADAATAHTDSDAWVVRQISEYLLGPGHTLTTLAAWLSDRGFFLEEPVAASNLFGDDQPAWLLHVQTSLGMAEDGLFLALADDPRGSNYLTLLHSAWNFDQGDSGWQDVADHNGNGRLEVLLADGARSGSIADATWLIYEWQTDHFQELTEGAVRTLEEGSPHWVASAEPGGTDRLEVVHLIPEPIVDAFVWDGSRYVSAVVPQPIQDLHTYRHQLALDSGQRVDLARQALTDWASLDPDDRRYFGPAYPDYIRFQLAFGLAIAGDMEAARTEFEALRGGQATLEDDSTHPGVIRDAAQAFLTGFHHPEDVYRSCTASKLVLATALDQALAVAGSERGRAFQEAIGVSPEIMSTDVCDLPGLMPQLLEWAGAARVWDDPVTALQPYGVEVVDVQWLRLDGDDRDDVLWVVREPTLKGLDPIEIVWCLLSTDSSQTAQSLVILDVPESAPRESGIEVTAWDLPDHAGRGFILSLPKTSVGYMILRQTTTPLLTTLFQIYTAARITLAESGVVLDLEQTPTAYAGAMLRFRWDASIQTYRAVDVYSEWIAGDVDPTDAVQPLADEAIRLREVSAHWRQTEAARIAFLSALAQERLGDTEAAAREYRDLWQRYPGTAYAIMARTRLIPASASAK
ncbi:MAG: hypothetical protein JNL73_19010 [Anaerolineales bacterium]|nr:hypothetical protein [Anaerolineales bacterium]